MLYDLAPPLLLLASFGGIIIVVSRVMLRIRREQFSHEIRESAAATGGAGTEDHVFQPGTRSVRLVKNRLALVPQMAKESVVNARAIIAERKVRSAKRKEEKKREQEKPKEQVEQPVEKQEMAVQVPQSNWRDRLSKAYAGSKGKLTAAKSSISETIPRRVALRNKKKEENNLPVSQATKPASKSPVRLVTVEEKPELKAPAEHKGAFSRLIHKEKEEPVPEAKSPTEKASQAIAASDYDAAEDVLVAHIVKHTNDATAYMLLGKVAVARQEWNEAVEIFQQVLEINSNNPGARACLGLAALEAGKMTLALESLQRAHDENPADADVLKGLLTIANRMDNTVLRKSVTEKLKEGRRQEHAASAN